MIATTITIYEPTTWVRATDQVYFESAIWVEVYWSSVYYADQMSGGYDLEMSGGYDLESI